MSRLPMLPGRVPAAAAYAVASGIAHVGAAGTPSQARLQSPLLLQTRGGAVLTRDMLYFLRQVGANAPLLLSG